MISNDLLNILACPACKSSVVLEENKIVCTRCKRKYSIRDGIPLMLTKEERLKRATN